MKSALILAAGLAAGLTFASTAQAQYAPPSAAPYPAGPPPAQYLPPPPDAGDRTIVRPAGVEEQNHGDWTLKRREEWLDHKINQAHDEHVLGNHEADNAHHQLDRLRDDENRMRGRQDGQLTDNQTVTLEARLDTLSAQVIDVHNDAWRRPW
jgi:hypothetical protein